METRLAHLEGNVTSLPGNQVLIFPGLQAIIYRICSYITTISSKSYTMKKPFLLFSIKAAVILYFAACTSIDHYTVSRSASPVVTKGIWKVNFFMDANNDRTNDFAGYTFTFNESGIINASKNGIDIAGSWFEDDISKRITIDLGATDPSLTKLNTKWSIQDVSNVEVELQDNSSTATGKLNITTL